MSHTEDLEGKEGGREGEGEVVRESVSDGVKE